MRFYWRNEPIRGHAGWRQRIAKKDDQQNRSAPTIAAAWSGLAELVAALDGIPAFEDMVLESVSAEVQTALDAYPGGKRNHDLVVVGTARGGPCVVCVEAKAGETLGSTIGEVIKSAEARKSKGENTNARQRLDGLLADWAPGLNATEERVQPLRYQLFTTLAGTAEEADNRQADHAVLMVHEFLTDERGSEDNQRDLATFMETVFEDTDLPGDDDLPWCVELRPGQEDQPALYLARAVTNLRPASSEA